MSALTKANRGRGFHEMEITKDATRRMEDEARKMELKMEMLRKTLDGPDSSRNSDSKGGDSGSRWKSGSAKKPIRTGYVKDVLETKPTRPAQGKPARGDAGARSRNAPAESVDQTMLRPGGSSLSGSRGGSGQTTPTQAEPQGTFSSALAGSIAPPPAPAPAVRGAAANLQAALTHQSREALEVEAFLAGLGLDRYVSLFNEHGFDCMEVVKEMQESHMRDIGMATGHALKLRKRLAELNPAPTPAPAPAPVQAAATAQSGALSSTAQKRVSFGGTEEAKVRSPSGTGTGGGSLWGHFDEAEQEAGFKDAVKAWREGRSGDEGQPAKAEPAAAEPKASPGGFWSSVGADEVNLHRFSTPISAAAGTATEPHDPAPSEDKLCCYQCYKQFFAKYAVERCSPLPDQTTRRLCSDVCANLWMSSQQAKVEELQQRHEKLAKLEEMKRAMDVELKAAQGEAGAEPAIAA